ncbi:MAG TPA: FAD/NAD(P)-binding protein, partial [Holophagaceae bacterium]|nr:FAD/NAD(P)-binding protein [Holophagaceae bacterium]
ERFDLAILGAGASGALVAIHLHAAAPGSAVAVLDAGARAARGLAYGTPYGAHLLNVPAGRMSAVLGDPGHFQRWLEARGVPEAAGVFAPRASYGDYLAELLEGVCAPPSRFRRLGGTAVGMTREASGWVVHLQDGRALAARRMVLAPGNLAPSDPLGLGAEAPEAYLRDPWAPGAAQGLDRDAPILLLGTGLTMVDLALALRAEGHRGRIHAISRRGLLPRAHAAHAPWPLPAPPERPSPRAAVRWLRAQARAAAEAGSDWRAAVDGLRPHTSAIWAAWTLEARRSFLRHARPFWEVHRHRTAPEVAAELQGLLETGQLQVRAGRILTLRETGEGLAVAWRPRGASRDEELGVARVINCTGPASDYQAADQPLLAQLRRAGWLMPDPLRLGVETGPGGEVLDREGRPVPGLFTLGPLRRPALWESTAIPEIRAQAADLARRLAAAPAAT